MSKKRNILAAVLLILGLSIAAIAAVQTSQPDLEVVPLTDMDGKDGYFLIRTPLPDNSEEQHLPLTVVVKKGDIYLTNAVRTDIPAAGTGDLQKRNRTEIILTGRFQTPGPARVTLEFNNKDGKPQKSITMAFRLPDTISKAPEVRTAWANGQQTALLLSDPENLDSFTQYWNLAIAPRYGLTDSGYSTGANSRREAPDLYSIFTGAAAIQESLQLETITGSSRQPSAENVPLASLHGPSVKSHPFRQMLNGRSPALPRLAALIPEDQYALFFKDINKQTELEDLMEEWGGNLLHQATANSREFKVRTKISRQLCLTSSRLSRWFGDRIVADMAFTGSDPFLKEGSAFTVLFTLKDEKRFKKHLQSAYAEAAAKFDAVQSNQLINGITVMAISSQDRTVSSYSIIINETAIVSNSLGAIRRILDVCGKKAPSLSQADDFKYMRTIFLQDAKEEDIFIYLSDAHIRHLVSPGARIGEARRIRCSANMTLISNARLWFATEKRREPTARELEEGGYLGASFPTCPDHGVYSLDKAGRPSCSLHNRNGHLTPVAEIKLERVTSQEAEQYLEFVNEYNRYWTQFFDPIGIRVRMGENIRVQTVILPLIENSWYDGLAAFAGRKPGSLTEHLLLPRTVVSLRGHLKEDWPAQSGLIDFLSRQSGLKLDWLGNEISLNLCDGQVLFSAGSEASRMMQRGLGRSPSETLVAGYLASALNLPTYAAIKVTDPLKAEKSIPAMFRSSMGRHSDPNELYVETYTIQDHRGKTVYVANYNLWLIKLRLYSAVIGDRLVISSRRDIITELIDADLKGKGRKTAANDGSLELSVYRSAFKELAEHVNIGWQEEMRHACHNNIPLATIMMWNLGMTPEKMAGSIMQLRGYEPYCPSGGRYSLAAGGKRVVCSIHGNRYNPLQPADAAMDSKTTRLVNSLKKVNVRMSFTEEGLMTTLEINRSK